MKYRVNLFPQELKPKLNLLTVGFVVLMWVLSGVILFAVSESYKAKYDDMQVQTRDTQQEYNQKTTTLKTYTEARDNRAQDPELVAEVEKLRGEARDKQLLLDELRGREQLKNQGFSLLMDDLAKSHVENIWLNRINIEEKKIRIEGATLESAAVPLWVSQLRESTYFSGRSFAGARMFRDDQDELNFVISSDLIEMALETELSGDNRGSR